MSEEVQIADDDSCATKIRRIGDEIHNLSCRHQNDDDLSGELGSLSFMCWAYSKEVAALKKENERLKARVEELENIVRAIRDHDVEQTAQAILSKGAMQDFLLPLAIRERIASIIEAKDE